MTRDNSVKLLATSCIFMTSDEIHFHWKGNHERCRGYYNLLTLQSTQLEINNPQRSHSPNESYSPRSACLPRVWTVIIKERNGRSLTCENSSKTKTFILLTCEDYCRYEESGFERAYNRGFQATSRAGLALKLCYCTRIKVMQMETTTEKPRCNQAIQKECAPATMKKIPRPKK